MRIIISPAKKMRVDNDDLVSVELPFFLEKTEILLAELRNLSYAELKDLLQCNNDIAKLNYQRLLRADLRNNLTAAVLAYDGLQYKYMAPRVFEDKQWEYIAEHLYILSGFYGILRAMDGVVPYRLEMQTRCNLGMVKDLYSFWGDFLYQRLTQNEKNILNLASKEYSKTIEKYLSDDIRYITCVFGVLQEGRVKVKATEAKIARGEMVRWCAENSVLRLDDVCFFNRLGYQFDPEKSSEKEFVFIKS